MAAILHDPALKRHQPDLLEAVATATRLALENQRLRAEVELSREIPPGLAERLQGEGARIGDVRTLSISVLMSDIRGYSTIAERADLRTLAGQLHEHRVAMNRVIAGQRGTVMQFVGDAVFAVFGAPVPMDDHAILAVRAAMEMQAAQLKINRAWVAVGLPAFHLGIGVTTGDVAAALLGSPEHVEYSVVGDVVNLAQRLQAWAAAGEIVISDATFSALSERIDAEALLPATVKGRRAPVSAYRIAAPRTA